MASAISSELNFSSLGRNFIIGTSIGVGIGVGIGIGVITTRRLWKSKYSNENIIVHLTEMNREIHELQCCLETVTVKLEESLSQLQAPVQSANRERNSNSIKDANSVRASSDDEDEEFFDMDKDDEIVEFLTKGFIIENESSAVSKDDEINEVFKQVDTLFASGSNEDKLRIHTVLTEETAKHPDSSELLWRFARSYFDMSTIKGKSGDAEGKKTLLYEGVRVALKALDLDDTNPESHKWYAILVGTTTDYESLQDQILLGYKYKEHIQKAIQLNGRDPSNYHLLGRWCYEVSMLSWWQRKAAATFVAEPPTSSIEEALDNFMKGEEIQPGFWKSNSYWIAKCYYEQSQYGESKKWLQKALTLPAVTEDDREAHSQAEELLRYL